MKRKIAFVFLLVVVAAICFLGYSIHNRIQQKQAVAERIATLPNFELVNLKAEVVNSSEITKKSAVIITYFSTECPFCRAEIKSMINHELLLDNANIYLISGESIKALNQFAKTFSLDSLQAIQILHDSKSRAKKLFGVNGVPHTFVYGKQGKLLKQFEGETTANLLFGLIKRSANNPDRVSNPVRVTEDINEGGQE